MKNIEESKLEALQPMQEFLKSRGKKAEFTSQVFYIKEHTKAEWVLKLLDEEAELKELTEAIGEVAAFKISKKAKLNLVPETSFATYRNNFGTIQKFVDNALNKTGYEQLFQSDNIVIQSLKLFWFIVGQWDTSFDNVLFTLDEQPIAIDNANIANIQAVSNYGGHHFVRLFYSDADDRGSIDNPITVRGAGIKVAGELNAQFGENFPEYFKNSFNRLRDKEISFTFFIKENRVWRNFNNDEEIPKYFNKKFSKSLLERFKDINYSKVFYKLIDKCVEDIQSNMLDRLETDKDGLINLLKGHFNTIVEGISSRYEMAENYLVLQESIGHNILLEPSVSISGSPMLDD